mgnify:CR=1 FL=1
MTQRTNEYGQPIGAPMPHWSPRPAPTGVTLKGRFCQLEPLNAARHAADLFAAYQTAPDGRNWTYLFIGPFASEDEYRRHAEAAAQSTDPRHFAVIDPATADAELERRLAESNAALTDWRRRLDEANTLLVNARTGPEMPDTRRHHAQPSHRHLG